MRGKNNKKKIYEEETEDAGRMREKNKGRQREKGEQLPNSEWG